MNDLVGFDLLTSFGFDPYSRTFQKYRNIQNFIDFEIFEDFVRAF